jgi:ATP-dependent DNA helicase RecQ
MPHEPLCPEHRIPLVLKTIETGPNVGQQVLRCSRHETHNCPERAPVEDPIKGLSGCWVAIESHAEKAIVDPGTNRFVGHLYKMFNRGSAPALHPDSERSLLEEIGLADQLVPPRLPGDIAPRLRDRPPERDLSPPVRQDQSPPLTDDLIEVKGERELFEWMKQHAPRLIPFLIPQAPFDDLLSSRGGPAGGQRRCDFLVARPGVKPLVIEFDEDHHEGQQLIDGERDRLLDHVEIRTCRITESEFKRGTGPGLDRLQKASEKIKTASQLDQVVWAPIQTHRLVLAICASIRDGLLSDKQWSIRLHDPTRMASKLVGPYLETIAALARIWGQEKLMAETVIFVGDDETITYTRQDSDTYLGAVGEPVPADVEIRLECDQTPIETLPARGSAPLVVIRSSYAPVVFSDQPIGGPEPRTVVATGAPLRAALLTVLRAVFAKEGFLEGQFEAVREILEGRDCAVLLPTGAGKSIIYQLAGLCLPGRTIVVDPIIALLEDQIRGLRVHGIDRVAGISSQTTRQGQTDRLLAEVANADSYFVLVAPERFQDQRFRDALKELVQTTPVNLVVVDEAHCVSEWGHDFRTAYLNFGELARDKCKSPGGISPPILALTGTASRAVLKDTLFQLGIDEATGNTLIKPTSLDRPELKFDIRLASIGEAQDALKGALRGLPQEFGRSDQGFFDCNGDETFSGLVFVQTVNADFGFESYSLPPVKAVIPNVRTYSGTVPSGENWQTWETRKRENAQAFIRNEITALLTTKSFGMGIDKPNIRWVIHFGLPGSIESYYQEAGRAGRDRQRAQCVFVLSEHSAARNRRLLSADLSLDDVKTQHQAVDRGRDADDVTSAVYLHKSSYPGIDAELGEVAAVAEFIDDGHREILFGEDEGRREKALHRLAVLGVIDDYTVGWGSKSFTVTPTEVTPGDICSNLARYVERSDPGRSQRIQDVISADYEKLSDAIEACGRVLLEFVYDTIEVSRRRSLREMYIAVTDSEDGEQFRERILGFLTEGDLTPVLTDLLDMSPFRFEDWIEKWNEILTPEDAVEVRNASANLLASSGRNPGLLISRGVAEALIPGGDTHEFETNLESAILNMRTEYSLEESQIELVFNWLIRTLHERAPHAVAALLAVAAAEKISSRGMDQWMNEHWQDNPDLVALWLTDHLERALELADTALVRYPEV